MRATRCMVALFALITTLAMVGCALYADGDHDDVGYTFCSMPAPLYGDPDEPAVGYIFEVDDGVNHTEEVARLSAEYHFEIKRVFENLPQFSALMSEETMERLRCEPTITKVWYNGIIVLEARHTSAPGSF